MAPTGLPAASSRGVSRASQGSPPRVELGLRHGAAGAHGLAHAAVARAEHRREAAGRALRQGRGHDVRLRRPPVETKATSAPLTSRTSRTPSARSVIWKPVTR